MILLIIFSDTSSNGEQTKILTKDYLGIPDEWQIVDPYVKPTKDDPTVLESKTQEILFVPSDKPCEFFNMHFIHYKIFDHVIKIVTIIIMNN